MAALEWGGWTLPGGGIHPGESGAQAAVREAWEECGAHVEVIGEPVMLQGRSGIDAACYPMRLRELEPSPEGRPVAWANLRGVLWRADPQLRQVLLARGQRVPSEALAGLLQQFHRLKWRLDAWGRG